MLNTTNAPYTGRHELDPHKESPWFSPENDPFATRPAPIGTVYSDPGILLDPTTYNWGNWFAQSTTALTTSNKPHDDQQQGFLSVDCPVMMLVQIEATLSKAMASNPGSIRLLGPNESWAASVEPTDKGYRLKLLIPRHIKGALAGSTLLAGAKTTQPNDRVVLVTKNFRY